MNDTTLDNAVDAQRPLKGADIEVGSMRNGVTRLGENTLSIQLSSPLLNPPKWEDMAVGSAQNGVTRLGENTFSIQLSWPSLLAGKMNDQDYARRLPRDGEYRQ